MNADVPEAADSADLGAAAQLLFEDGKTQAAALLIDARIVRRVYIDTFFEMGALEAPGIDGFRIWLEVPRFLVERFTAEVLSEVQDALNEVLERDNVTVMEIEVRGEIPPAGDEWRADLLSRMSPRPTNQATIGPRSADLLMEDRCQFRSMAELRVYRAFKRVRDARFPPHDTFAIAPNPALVVPSMNTSEPDLLIVYRGKAGIVQVDGPQHRGHFAKDASRQRQYRLSGIAEVDHLPVEDTATDDELDQFALGFLFRLGGRV